MYTPGVFLQITQTPTHGIHRFQNLTGHYSITYREENIDRNGLDGLLHLRDVQLNVRLHLQILIVCSMHLILNVLLQVEHLADG